MFFLLVFGVYILRDQFTTLVPLLSPLFGTFHSVEFKHFGQEVGDENGGGVPTEHADDEDPVLFEVAVEEAPKEFLVFGRLRERNKCN